MSEQCNEIVISSRVRLARNYHDLPFSNLDAPDNAHACVERARAALAEDGERSYRLFLLADMPKVERLKLMEKHLVSLDLLRHSDVGAALIRDDEAVCVMVNEEDHLRIQAMLRGLALTQAAELAFAAEEKLQRSCEFSFDSQLGYLTACPTNTGTGMRASLMLHLPLLTRRKQMGAVGQTVAKLGLTIRGIYGEGSDALGELYQVSNQVTLGRTEKEIGDAVLAVGKQLIDMESALREQERTEQRLMLEDRVFRSYALMRYARSMDDNEFMRLWSDLRLGASQGLIPVALETCDELLTVAQDAHVKRYQQSHDIEGDVESARCDMLRERLDA